MSRLARIQTPGGPRPVVAEGEAWHVVADLFDQPLRRTGEQYPVDGTRLLAPVEPRVVLGMAHNGGPDDRRLPPQAFQKSPRTVVGPQDPIRVDPSLGRTNAEGELVLVLRSELRFADVDQVADAVLGWTIGNDVTAVDQAGEDQYAVQVKCGDGYTPLGPWIETELPGVLDCAMTMFRDQEQVAAARTSQLAWNPYEALAHLSRYLRLGPGDVLLTGSPGTGFAVEPGNLCRCEIEGLGALVNPVLEVERPDGR